MASFSRAGLGHYKNLGLTSNESEYFRMAVSSDTKEVTIHTDGACDGNPGPGGWAAVLLFG